MDILTQGIAGTLLAQTATQRNNIRLASLVGFLGGMLADADVFIQSANDPLLNLEFHRQFTHSFLFIPVGALIVALLLWPLLKKRMAFLQLFLFGLLGYSTSGLLDACTSYGTQLLWPFSSERITWSIISIVDPLFSGALLVMVILAWKTRKKTYAFLGIGLALGYLMLSLHQQQSVTQLQRELAQSRGHVIEQSVVKPTIGNTLLWRSVYLHEGRYYVDAIRKGWFSQARIYPGSSIKAFSLAPPGTDPANKLTQDRDLERFHTLSQGYLVRHPDEPQVIADIRFAMLPDSIRPLWGIRLHPDRPSMHVSEVTYRKLDETTKKRFLEMLFGA